MAKPAITPEQERARDDQRERDTWQAQGHRFFVAWRGSGNHGQQRECATRAEADANLAAFRQANEAAEPPGWFASHAGRSMWEAWIVAWDGTVWSEVERTKVSFAYSYEDPKQHP
jgi:hypothetical protein